MPIDWGRAYSAVAAIMLLIVYALIAVWILGGVAGCVSQAKVLSPDEVDVIAAAVVKQQSAARDINEPWTARIMAVGQQLWPLAMLIAYVLSKRSKIARRILDRVKGKNGSIELLVAEAVQRHSQRHESNE